MKTNQNFRRALSLAGCAALMAGFMSLPVAAASAKPGSTVVVAASESAVHQGPGSAYAVVGTLKNGYMTTVIRAEDGYGYIGNGWIDLEDVKVTAASAGGSVVVTKGYKGYVTAKQLNLRTGPGTNYPVCGTLANGYQVTVIDTEGSWGKVNGGWICLDYVGSVPQSSSPVYNPNLPSTTPPTAGTPTGNQVQVTANQLNIRKGPGTGYEKIATYGLNQQVEILEYKGNWGRTNRGWICLDYTTHTPIAAETQTPVVNHKGLTAGSTVRVAANSLRVRSGAGLGYTHIGTLSSGYTAKLLEVSGDWGRIDNGWICLDYVNKV